MKLNKYEAEYQLLKEQVMDNLGYTDDSDDLEMENHENLVMRETDRLFFKKFGFKYSDRED